MAKFAVLGMGGFGIALSVMLNKFGHDIVIWSPFEDELNAVKKDGENKHKLPGVKLDKKIKLTSDVTCVSGCEIALLGIPTEFMRSTVRLIAPYLSDKAVVLSTSKGLEVGSNKRMSEVIKEELPSVPAVILSGPSHAEEVGIGMPTTVAVSSADMRRAEYIQKVFGNSDFRVYVNDDLIGCELGGSLKNVIALCAGICSGMGYGDNTIAALMTRGVTEIARLGVALGGRLETFAGLTGIGDLIVTCTSLHSRNRRAGVLIGQGLSPDEAVKQVGTVEGYSCAKAAYELSKEHNVVMPITEQCYNVIVNGLDPKAALKNLMRRPNANEVERIWTN
ncbi:MAG: NAD(P)-dependent glycerol-3-phosphate dehydrogenase [Oscillospiraceae bacterium]|nr:NAD(P)-dependent glycerol-3-phosphate dehydrogenase [Oscillospiraceae bacterium]